MQKINEEKLDKRKSVLYTYIVEERRFLTAIFHHRHHAREQLKIHAHYLILHACSNALSIPRGNQAHCAPYSYTSKRRKKREDPIFSS